MRYLLLLATVSNGCVTAPVTDTLGPGQSAASITLGGPAVSVPNGPTIPLPNISVEYRRGAGANWDWNVGTHLLAPVFGAAGAHLGATMRLKPQAGHRPMLLLGERLYLFSNHLDGRKPADSQSFWLNNEITLTAVWKMGNWSHFLSLIDHFDFALPGLVLSPAMGTEYRLGSWRFFGEMRWFGAGLSNAKAVLAWYGINDLGALGFGLGFSRHFGGQ